MRSTIDRLRRSHRPDFLMLRGMVRRLAVKVTDAVAGGLWQLIGYVHDPAAPPETFDDVEVFGNVGFYSRPKAGNPAEVVVANIGGENGHPVVVATRDASIQVALLADETAIFNSTGALVKIKANGDIVIVPKAGGNAHLGGDPAVEPTIRATTYRGAEDTWFTAVNTAIAAIGTWAAVIGAACVNDGLALAAVGPLVGPPAAAPCATAATSDGLATAASAALVTAIAALNTALSAFTTPGADYKTTVAKVT